MARKNSSLHPLAIYRRHFGVTATAVAEAVGLSCAQISRIEYYTSHPPYETRVKIIDWSNGALTHNCFDPVLRPLSPAVCQVDTLAQPRSGVKKLHQTQKKTKARRAAALQTAAE